MEKQIQEVKQNWYFTFGVDNELHKHHYIKIFDTFNGARCTMVNNFGIKWCFQYPEAEFKSSIWFDDLEEFVICQVVDEFFMIDDYPCIAFLNPYLKTWCGYCGVSPQSPLFEKDYDDICIDCHGGLTYSGFRVLDIRGFSTPEISEYADYAYKDHWFFGFDCAHYHDLVPGSPFGNKNAVYRNLDFVKKELKSVAAQIRTLEGVKELL